MNKTSSYFSSFLFIICFFGFTSQMQAQFGAEFPLEVTVEITPPYPVRFSEIFGLESNIVIQVMNNGDRTENGILTGFVRNEDNGFRIATDAARLPRCLNFPPGMTLLTGAELNDYYNINDLIFDGAGTGITRTEVMRGQALPDGAYSLCFQVIPCTGGGLPLSADPDMFMGCGSFDISYLTPPEWVSECDQNVPVDGSLNLQWFQQPPPPTVTLASGINYNLRIVEVYPDTRDPNDAINSSTTPDLYNEDFPDQTSLILAFPDDIPTIEAGKLYVMQVTASDPEGRITFHNEGKSAVCTFRYGAGAGAGGVAFHSVYPQDGDYIPWDYFPFIVKFDPYSDEYSFFESNFTLYKGGSQADTKYRDSRWPRGPLVTQRNLGFSGMTQEESQHLPVYKNVGDPHHDFERGADYAWQSEALLRRNSTDLTGSSGMVDFNHGMSAPVLSTPSNNATVPPGDIDFNWLTAEKPNSLVPPFDITQISGRSGPNFFNGGIDEKWILEISRTRDFAAVLRTDNERLGSGLTLTSVEDSATVIAALYKDVDRTFNFTDSGDYYWRVKWMKNPDNESAGFYSESPIWKFSIGTGSDSTGGGTPVAEVTPPPTPPGPCVSRCLADEITDSTAVSSLNVEDEVLVGQFTMKITTVSGSGRFTGNGEIVIPFLNNARILVGFENIRINAARKVFEGKVKAIEDVANPLASAASTVIGGLGNVSDVSADDAAIMQSVFDDGERLVSFMTGNRAVGLPIGIDQDIDGVKYILAITEMKFDTDKASFDAMFRLDLPEVDSLGLIFGTDDFCLTPNGFGDELKLGLAVDHVIGEEEDVRINFKSADGASFLGTYLEFDCSGMKCMNIEAEVLFPRSEIVPDTPDGTPGEGEVKGRFRLRGCREEGIGLLAMIDMDKFQIADPALEGYAFEANEIWLDLSSSENPTGIRFPANFANEDVRDDDEEVRNTWTGFYIRSLNVSFPHFIKKFRETERVEIAAENMIIDFDDASFTAQFRARNIIPYPLGDLEGWAFSMDSVYLDFVSGSFTQGGFGGKIHVPIMDSTNYFGYRTTMGLDTADNFSLEFLITMKDTINTPLYMSKLMLAPNSRIRVAYDHARPENKFQIEALFNGAITIDGGAEEIASSIPGLNMSGLKFENLLIQNKDPYINPGAISFGHASPQKSMSNFPINIDNIHLVSRTLEREEGSGIMSGFGIGLGIQFDITITLSGSDDANGPSGTTMLSVWGRFQAPEGERQFVAFDGIQLDGVELNDIDLGVVVLSGGVRFYNRDATYGNGFKGWISAEFNPGGGASATVQFGEVDGYKYWYVDAMVKFTPGTVVIGTGLEMIGLGGGAYHHMRMAEAALPNALGLTTMPDGEGSAGSAESGEPGIGESKSGVRYVPDRSLAFGFKATIAIATVGSQEVFNADVTLEANFNEGGGINYIGLRGNAYFVKPPTDRMPGSSIEANLVVEYDFAREIFHGQLDVFVNVMDLIKGITERDGKYMAGSAVVHFEPGLWYIHIGTPSTPVGLDFVGIFQTRSYLMIGMNIPDMPPPPDRVMAEIGDIYTGASATASVLSADGFAFGSSMQFGPSRMNFLIFFAEFGFGMGFDVNLRNYGDLTCRGSSAPLGINGWYAQGQVWAWIMGKIGIEIDVWFFRGEFDILSLQVAALLQGGLPNPVWMDGYVGGSYSVLGGLAKGNCNFKVTIGEKCEIDLGPPVAGIKVITDVQPIGADVDVFINPQAAYSASIGDEIQYTEYDSEGRPNIRTFRAKLDFMKLVKVENGQEVAYDAVSLEQDNTVSTLDPSDALEGETRYKVQVKVSWEEYKSGRWETVYDTRPGRRGQRIEEDSTVYFTTGPRPDHIPAERVFFAYPFRGQRFFLQDECRNGIIKMKENFDYLFEVPEAPPSSGGAVSLQAPSYSFKARFTPMEGGEPIFAEVTKRRGDKIVRFTIPRLDQESHYSLQILRVRGRDLVSEIRESAANPAFRGRNAEAISGLTLRMAMGNTLEMTEAKILPGTRIGRGEHQLFQYFFKTSDYNRLSEKLSKLTQQGNVEYLALGDLELLKPKFEADEAFDHFELKGIKQGGTTITQPLIQFYASWNETWHRSLINYYVYNNYDELVTEGHRPSRFPGGRGLRGPYRDPIDPYGVRPARFILVDERESRIKPPLSQWELQAQFTPPTTSTASTSSGNIIGSYIDNHGSSFYTGSAASFNTIQASFLPAYVFTDHFTLQYAIGWQAYIDYIHMKNRVAPRYYGSEFISRPLNTRLGYLIHSRYPKFIRGSNYGINFLYITPQECGCTPFEGNLPVSKTQQFRY